MTEQELQEVLTYAVEPPISEDGSASFQVGGQWYSMTIDRLRWLENKCKQYVDEHPTNQDLLNCAFHYELDFTKVGRIIYIHQV